MESVDRRANEIGRKQRGRATRRQLVNDAGISPWSVTNRLKTGCWTEPRPGVIDLGTHQPSWRAQVLEILLAAGPDAWASHDTAAHLHGFLDVARPDGFDVVVPRGRRPVVGDLRLHTTTAIGADEVTERHGLACTTPARTLLDLSVGTAPPVLERLVANETRRSPKVIEQLVALSDRHRRLPGRRRLVEVLARLPAAVDQLGSPLEVLGVQRLRQLGAPPFVLQYVVRDEDGARLKRVDVAWPELRTVLEFDGVAYHDLLDARRHDDEVRARMRALGWHVEVVRRADLEGPELAGFVRRLRTNAM